MTTVIGNLIQTHAQRESLRSLHQLTSAGFKLAQLVSPSDTTESLHAEVKELLIAAFLSNAC